MLALFVFKGRSVRGWLTRQRDKASRSFHWSTYRQQPSWLAVDSLLKSWISSCSSLQPIASHHYHHHLYPLVVGFGGPRGPVWPKNLHLTHCRHTQIQPICLATVFFTNVMLPLEAPSQILGSGGTKISIVTKLEILATITDVFC